ncbi:hypothetical protein WA026_018033 [Henosepilachna vigintioctopunctata]|uniref:PHD-type domain-containing protein n=1 Tax=Henosepilachna vigintioctopunctata TaxID=420089 RepID=A0AAW1UDW0_9CUCU
MVNKKTTKKKTAVNHLLCGFCKKQISKTKYKIPCSGTCSKYFHEDCTTLDKDQLKKLKDGKMEWLCITCSTVEESEQESGTGSDSDTEEETDDDTEMDTEKSQPTKNKRSAKRNITLEDIAEKLDMIWNTISSQKQEIKKLKRNIQELKQDNIEIRREIEKIKSGKNSEKQSSLRNNIIINGFNEIKATELKGQVLKTLKLIKNDLADNDIDKCTIIGKNEKPMIRVILKNYEDKKEIMKAKRDVNLSTKNLGLQDDRTLYLNHELTRENQILFKQAREMKKDFNYKYIWATEENIKLRKTEGSTVITIKDKHQLDEIKNNESKNNDSKN